MGTSLRVRARRFPALVQCTTMDWFHPWTHEALQSVSYRFLQEIEGIEVWPCELLSQLPYCFHQLLSLDSCHLFYVILQLVCQGCTQRFLLMAERGIGRLAIFPHPLTTLDFNERLLITAVQLD